MYKGFIHCVKLEKFRSGVIYGLFMMESLKPGQGITIANQLRRILLTELGGKAITKVRIEGINHEYSTIAGVREDVLELLLNLKGIVFKSPTKSPNVGFLKAKGPLVVTADLLTLPRDLRVVNKNHYIATVATNSILDIKFKIEYGTGYRLATESLADKEKQVLQLDSVFMPIQKVNFKIDNHYDIENILDERLFFEIWTDGSISPIDALKESCKLTVELFNSFIIKDKTKLPKKLPIKKIHGRPFSEIVIEELNLSTRPYNCLKKAQINTLADLVKCSAKQLLELRSFGKKSVKEVYTKLKEKFGINQQELLDTE
uniref:DNA-directed RNA polymerase subunit alpha n=1 Tax=Astrosyne radiata TaxID=1158023 RepID=A0A2U9NTA2_9STRA|nr:RNA polymerase alpha subunit [Astrosyne radiata]AWT40370.1 RNA polymerase alpha subunit [Astrosyne radiata]